jgi:hypothetical protein
MLVLVGLLFLAGIYPFLILRQQPVMQMMLSVYVTLGIFILFAARNPSANRSLIAFAGWSSLAHAATMAVQAYFNLIPRHELVGVLVFIVLGMALIVLTPAKMNVAAR